MVMSIDCKTLGGQRAGYVVISAEMLAHAMDKYDDARARLTPIRGPAIAGKLLAVGGSIAERV
jgi:hypothetical protein